MTLEIKATIKVLVDDKAALIEEHGDPEEPEVETALEAALDDVQIPGCTISASIRDMTVIGT